MGLLKIINAIPRYTSVELVPKHSSLFKYFFYQTELKNLVGTFQDLVSNLDFDQIHILQIGANDGVFFDPVYPLTKLKNVSLHCFEPVPDYFSLLELNYSDNKNVRSYNYAIGANNSEMKFYKVKAASLAEHPDWAKGTSTFYLDNLRLVDIKTEDIENIDVKMITYKEALELCNLKCPNVLVIDAEGHDTEIFNSINFDSEMPEIILFEHFFAERNIGSELFQNIIDTLFANGYLINFNSQDIVCYKPNNNLKN